MGFAVVHGACQAERVGAWHAGTRLASQTGAKIMSPAPPPILPYHFSSIYVPHIPRPPNLPPKFPLNMP